LEGKPEVAKQISLDGVPIKDIDLMTPREVADAFRVDVHAVARWARDGKLTRIPMPNDRDFRYLRSEVMDVLAAGTVERVA
jgi:hypothetical protein